MDETYNDIQQWRYKDLIPAFGADPKKSRTYTVKTKQEAEDLFNDEGFSAAPYLQVSGSNDEGWWLVEWLGWLGGFVLICGCSWWSCICRRRMRRKR